MGGIKVTGKAQLIQNLNWIRYQTPTVASKAALRAIQLVEAKSVAVCPIDQGTLVNSRMVELDDRGQNNAAATLSYNTEYAAAVHEKPGQKFTRAGATNKYLENPLKESATAIRMIAIMAFKSLFAKGHGSIGLGNKTSTTLRDIF